MKGRTANEPGKFPRLECAERWFAGLIAAAGLGLCVWLLLCAPIRYTVVTDSKHNQTTTQTWSDETTVLVTLLGASAAFLFYAVNGLRVNKFSAAGFSLDSSPNPSSFPYPEPLPPSPGKQLAAPAAVGGAVVENEQDKKFRALSGPAQKVLRTLWNYQTRDFPGNFGVRWTFRLLPGTPYHSEYLVGLGRLLQDGLVFVSPANDQCGLTNEGVVLMESLNDHVRQGEFYPFW